MGYIATTTTNEPPLSISGKVHRFPSPSFSEKLALFRHCYKLGSSKAGCSSAIVGMFCYGWVKTERNLVVSSRNRRRYSQFSSIAMVVSIINLYWKVRQWERSINSWSNSWKFMIFFIEKNFWTLRHDNLPSLCHNMITIHGPPTFDQTRSEYHVVITSSHWIYRLEIFCYSI